MLAAVALEPKAVELKLCETLSEPNAYELVLLAMELVVSRCEGKGGSKLQAALTLWVSL